MLSTCGEPGTQRITISLFAATARGGVDHHRAFAGQPVDAAAAAMRGDGEREALAQKIAAHALAHHAKADKPDRRLSLGHHPDAPLAGPGVVTAGFE